MTERDTQKENISAFNHGLTRRNLLRRSGELAFASQLALGPYTLYAQEKDKQKAFDSSFLGFDSLTPQELYALQRSYYETPVDHVGVEYNPDEELYKVAFSLEESSQVLLTVPGGQHDTVFLDPLIAQSENKRRYFVPVVHTDQEGRSIPTTVNLGRYSEGEHTLTIKRHESVTIDPNFDIQKLHLSIPVKESLLTYFMEYNPVVKLKNVNNPLDDAPLVGFSKVTKRQKDNLYRVTSNIIFGNENGGKKPPILAEDYGRTVDIEWVMQQLFDVAGNPVGSPRYQTVDHRAEKFAGKTVFANQPVLDTATPNNNFDDGRITLPYFHYSFDNPFDDSEDDAIYFSPKPVFLSNDEGGADILAQMPELQRWSLIELGFENCLSTLAPELAETLSNVAKMRGEINTVFPDRGCQTLFSGENFNKLQAR